MIDRSKYDTKYDAKRKATSTFIRISKETHAKIKDLANKLNTSMSELVDKLVNDFKPD